MSSQDTLFDTVFDRLTALDTFARGRVVRYDESLLAPPRSKHESLAPVVIIHDADNEHFIREFPAPDVVDTGRFGVRVEVCVPIDGRPDWATTLRTCASAVEAALATLIRPFGRLRRGPIGLLMLANAGAPAWGRVSFTLTRDVYQS